MAKTQTKIEELIERLDNGEDWLGIRGEYINELIRLEKQNKSLRTEAGLAREAYESLKHSIREVLNDA